MANKASSGPLAQNVADLGSWSNSVALGDFNGDGRTDVITTDTAGYRGFINDPATNPARAFALPNNYGKSVVPLHVIAVNLSYVHTCKSVGAARRCHVGPDVDGDGKTDLILTQHAPVQPPDGKPKLSKGDIFSVCVHYPTIGPPCNWGGFWTAAQCPSDIW